MNETTENDGASRIERFRLAIETFIDERREAKLKGREDDAAAAAKYEYDTWLADAARRVGQIQAVTHVLKASHPDARGTSIYVPPPALPQHDEIGSHSLVNGFAEDVVGNAAALDVFKFLKVEVEGRSLLEWVKARDADLLQALHADEAIAHSRVDAFGSLVRSGTFSSHALAKQVYWLTQGNAATDDNFHLLQPLFSSALAHRVHADIQSARFGEESRDVRAAVRAKQADTRVYRDYRNLAVRKMGGTKPQNISQLNSERGGANYLLPSLPPNWSQQRSPNLLGLESSTERFTFFAGVRPLVQQLARLILSKRSKTMETRQEREVLEQRLGAKLPFFAAAIHSQLPPGWTRDDRCELPFCECLWLDPERLALAPRQPGEGGEDDQAFAEAYHWGDWPGQVAGIFASWLNDQLRRAGATAVGDSEYRHWVRQAIVDAAWPVPMQRRASEERS
ncbi:type I-F CRISPR-associated protein Csy1 [Halomonas salinarum]|uniref:type I-F CRISPR-associated protein Csy1 n=1 Tax=Halomonas salinarum TaxID=1158993 RepID=UPI0014395417|nr:type I-F CRISPR-associated protein Csy1 [Halomonas salinarum]